jgi:ribosomal protein L15E
MNRKEAFGFFVPRKRANYALLHSYFISLSDGEKKEEKKILIKRHHQHIFCLFMLLFKME